MNAREAVNQLKDLYQLDPCDGSRWVETSDIADAVGVAAIHGRAYLNDHVITWAEGAGFVISRDTGR